MELASIAINHQHTSLNGRWFHLHIERTRVAPGWFTGAPQRYQVTRIISTNRWKRSDTSGWPTKQNWWNLPLQAYLVSSSYTGTVVGHSWCEELCVTILSTLDSRRGPRSLLAAVLSFSLGNSRFLSSKPQLCYFVATLLAIASYNSTEYAIYSTHKLRTLDRICVVASEASRWLNG